MRYKVVELKVKDFFAQGQMKAKHLEKLLNEHAAEGWELDRLLEAEMQGFVGPKEVILAVFKKPE